MTSDLKLEAACKISAFYLNFLDQKQPVQNLVSQSVELPPRPPFNI